MVVIIFVTILALLQLQYSRNNQRDELINNYHFLISKKGLNLLSVIDKAKLWFEKQAVENYYTKRNTNSIARNKEFPSGRIQIGVTFPDHLNAIKNGRIIEIEADLFFRPGPRFINAVNKLFDNIETYSN